jgi:hypothetical protein
VVPLPPLAFGAEELALPCAEPDAAPDVLPEGCEPPLFWLVALEELLPLAFSVGCTDAEAVPPAALEPPLLSVVPDEAPADPVVAVAVCCWAGDGLDGLA